MKRHWPAEQATLVAVDDIRPSERNARVHSEAQIDKIARSVERFGWTMPLLVDEDNVLLAGHARLAAAKRLGLSQVPVVRAIGWTPEEKRAYLIADNQLTIAASWDWDILSAEIAHLRDVEFDLPLLGFSPREMDIILERFGRTQGIRGLDGVPSMPEQPLTRRGDLWALGPHRLLCGDATSPGDVGRLLEGIRPHLMVTDPPYGITYDPNVRRATSRKEERRQGRVTNDGRADWRDAWVLFPGDVAYIFFSTRALSAMLAGIEAAGFEFRAEIVWIKPRQALGRGNYHWRHESIYYGVRAGADAHWQGARDQTTVWEIAWDTDDDPATEHSTQKPVECMRRCIVNSSAEGEWVYEPFAGSGSTLIAAHRSRRLCAAMEISPAFCDVILERWRVQTGEEPVLMPDRRPLSEIIAERNFSSGPTVSTNGKVGARSRRIRGLR